MVSAWADHQQIVLGQLATDEKSNEITAVPALLEILDVAGCIITADSMSCQKEIVKIITEKKADYVLGLKNDQPTMHTEAKEYFDATLKDPRNYPLVQSARTRDFGHGRIETRTYHLTTEIDWFENLADWKDLHAFGMACSKAEQNGKITEDVRYFITLLDTVSTFAEAVRKHWGVENSLHWCLDITFREDYSRIRKDHSAENMAWSVIWSRIS